MTTVATHLVEALVNAGVKRIYGIVGDSLNSIVDAVHQNKTIEWIHVANVARIRYLIMSWQDTNT